MGKLICLSALFGFVVELKVIHIEVFTVKSFSLKEAEDGVSSNSCSVYCNH